ncbi:MAG: SH3 domain-containing protein [Clostridia bacterium]|nr:SH3 domain-containing protein [Clostridia bacterium]
MKTQNTVSKKWLSCAAAAAMALAPVASLAETADSALVKGGYLNLRKEASLTASVLGQFPTGTLVEIVEKGEEWSQVRVNGVDGYMMTQYLNTAEGETTLTVRTNTGIGLNLREAPSMEGAILTSFKPGTQVTVLQKGSNWSRVTVEGQEGFMSSKYLKSGSTSGSTAPAAGTAVVNNPKDTQVLNLRETPSLDARVLAYYKNGTVVEVIQKGDTWSEVKVNGKHGYMMNKFLKFGASSGSVTTPVTPFEATMININGTGIVNFRSKPTLGNNVIRTYPVGTKLTVTETGTDWFKVEIDGEAGYVSRHFLKY